MGFYNSASLQSIPPSFLSAILRGDFLRPRVDERRWSLQYNHIFFVFSGSFCGDLYLEVAVGQVFDILAVLVFEAAELADVHWASDSVSYIV